MQTVTRFCPSPSGSGAHLGSIRSAFFSYLVAKQEGGIFKFRVEDSNTSLCTKASEENIKESMKWLGLDWDNSEILRQSERFEIYKKVAHDLVDQGLAYKCFCSPERVDSVREEAKAAGQPAVYDGHCIDKQDQSGPYVIRFKTPKYGSTVVRDLVLGRLCFQNANIGDFVILRSNGEAPYLLANTYDDVVEGVNVIYRGNDGASGNLPKQVLLREALSPGNPATWGHPAMVLGEDGLKLSKSKGSPLVLDYRSQGYLPEALLNCLFRLGASAGNKEIFSKEEMIELFNPKNISKSDARFDPEKLLNLNKHWLRVCEETRLVSLLKPFLLQEGVTEEEYEKANNVGIANILRTRAKTLVDMADQSLFFYKSDFNAGTFSSEEVELLHLTADYSRILQESGKFSVEDLDKSLGMICDIKGIKLSQLFPVVRRALTGKTSSPPVAEVMSILGYEETISRLKKALKGG